MTTQLTFRTPEHFLKMAVACEEYLPDVIIATVSVKEECDGFWGAYVHSIADESGVEIDPTWLSEYAGYQFSLAEQIKMQAMNERFPGRY